MNIGTDYTTWKDDEGNQLTGDDLKYHQDKLLAHENYHAIQHSEGRDNYDIAHDTENRQWAEMQKRPEVMSTDAVWNNFYNRSDLENQQDYQDTINNFPESRILNQNLLFDKVLDRQRYDNPSNAEGEAKFYEDTGVDPSKGSSTPLLTYIPPSSGFKDPSVESYKQLNSTVNVNLVDPTPYTPSPTPQDYQVGRITRYIARQKGGTQFRVMEIDKTTFDNLTKQRGDVNYSTWRAISIQWLISGPLHDELVNGIKIRPGIIDTNEKILNQAEKNFIGIKQYLSDPTQFAR
jgi:hypothetical protein